jgi:hypothetical protein
VLFDTYMTNSLVSLRGLFLLTQVLSIMLQFKMK